MSERELHTESDAITGDKAIEAAIEAAEDTTTGVETPIEFNGVEIPQDTMTLILSFLSNPELVHCASLVNMSWLAASKNPALWSALTPQSWDTVTSTTHFLKLLRRPQFARLKSIAPPNVIQWYLCPDGFWDVRPDDFWEQIAESCPYLEELDLSRTLQVIPLASELPKLPSMFPHLKRFKMHHPMDPKPVLGFVHLMGGRLLELEIRGFGIVTDTTLKEIGQSCTNLQVFSYMELSEEPPQITSPAVMDLINAQQSDQQFLKVHLGERLLELGIRGFRGFRIVTDSMLKEIGPSCTKLEMSLEITSPVVIDLVNAHGILKVYLRQKDKPVPFHPEYPEYNGWDLPR